jgi:photosystem II stability/assembly factor-like uncharacterized protein
LSDWEKVAPFEGAVHSLTFHPAITGTIWAATDDGYVSRDGGQSWERIGGLPRWTEFTHGVLNFAIDAAADPAHPILYAATGKGLYKSTDGGTTWFESQQGLSGVSPYALAVSAHDVDEVYASTNSRGVLRSKNGGRSWQALDIPSPGWAANLAVDPFVPKRIYFSCQYEERPCVRISEDRGENWVTVPLALPERLDGWQGRTHVVAPHPTQPGRVLAGTGFLPPGWGSTVGWIGPQGGLYLSEDYGEHWALIQPTEPISHVSVIVYDSGDPQMVYAGTRGGTLLKSQDSGTNWELVYTWPGVPHIVAIAIDPMDSSTILVGLSGSDVPGSENGIYLSTDGGGSWELVGFSTNAVLAYDAHDPPFLYSGTWNAGLHRSADNGRSWQVAAGMGVGNIGALATAREGDRYLVYVGLSGGALAGRSPVQADPASPAADATLLGSGVFRLTTGPRQRVYLPMVCREGSR